MAGTLNPPAAPGAAQPATVVDRLVAQSPQPYEFPPDDPSAARYDLSLKETFVARDGDLANGLGRTDQQRRDYAKGWVELGRERNLNPAFVRRLIGYDIDGSLAAARGQDPMTQAELYAMERRAFEEVRGVYGDRADHLIARAQAFVKSDRRLAEVMEKEFIGSRPDVVMALVEHVHQTGWGRTPAAVTPPRRRTLEERLVGDVPAQS